MHTNYWREKWAKRQIAFHRSEANPHLVQNFARLELPKGSGIFVPLCGKTRDIAWLLDHGHHVCGSELVETAVEELFEELGIAPEISSTGATRLYHAANINIFVGDFFALSAEALGPVDAVYDRAALVALPQDMRERYTEHLMALTGSAPQLLVTYVYDQNLVNGPPFSIDRHEVRRHYGDSYDVRLIASAEVEGGLKGLCPAQEDVWELYPARSG